MKHRGLRRATSVSVRFFPRPAMMGAGLVVNVSPTGAFMLTQIPLRLLSVLYLEPTDPPLAEGAVGRLAATVVRSDCTGVGLEWCEFAAEMTRTYARLAESPDDPAEPRQMTLPSVPERLSAN